MSSPYLFTPVGSGGTTASAVNEPTELTNLALATSVSGNALTIALKGKDGNDPSVSNEVLIAFRDSTITSGVYVQRSVTAALSVVVSSGSTLGMASAVASYLYVYAIDNGGVVELAVINGRVDEGSVQTSTAEGGAGAADSANVLYSTSARTSKAVRLLGRILITEATAGTWASNSTEISIGTFDELPVVIRVTSSLKTPAASGQYQSLSNNSAILSVGTYRLTSYAAFTSSGGSPGYTSYGVDIRAANGADSGSEPADISTVSGLTVLSASATAMPFQAAIGTGGGIMGPPYIVRLTASATLYVVTGANETTAANARITAYMTAERLG